MKQTMITRIVQAALLAANRPLTPKQLHALFLRDSPVSDHNIQCALDTLHNECYEHGIELVEVASGFRYQVKKNTQQWISRLWKERPAKYTRAILETLALIAYRQPITRGEIEQVRGVAVNSSIIRTLEERDWVRVIGHRDTPGKPELFATTKIFLDYFELKSLDDLPPLSEIKDFYNVNPQLQLEPMTDEHEITHAKSDIPVTDNTITITVNQDTTVQRTPDSTQKYEHSSTVTSLERK